MLDLARRTLRKYENEGVSETLAAGWEIVFRKKLLKQHISPKIIRRSPYTTLHQSELVNTYSTRWMNDLEENIKVNIPPKTWVSPSKTFSDVEQYTIDSSAISEIDDVTLLGPVALGIADEQLIGDTIAPPSLLDNRLEVAVSQIIEAHGFKWTYDTILSDDEIHSRLPNLGTVCPLIPLWSNYYHWIVECILKLRGVEYYQETTGHVPTIVIPPDIPSWAKETLELMGVNPTDCLEFEGRGYQVDKLIVPTYPEPTPSEYRWLRKKAISAVDLKNKGGERIYISRRNATRRRIINESTVIETLSELGFSAYVLEDLSVSDQIQLFSDAEIIVGPHGAGFTNMLFSNDPIILEIFGDRIKTTFYRLAKIAGHEYHYLSEKSNGIDIQVNPDRLEEIITDLIDV